MERVVDNRPVFSSLDGKMEKELFKDIQTPCYVIDEKQLHSNGEILASVIKNTGCKILLAQKAFSNYNFYNILSEYISGTEASGMYEARLGAEEMKDKEVHAFCAAYRDDEFDELLKYADHIVFNSVYQLKKFGYKAKKAGKSIGLRINPECSTQTGHEIYDPCAVGSRLGVTRHIWDNEMTDEIISILDTSAACHMPDVIEMPYTPPLYGATDSKDKCKYTFRLAGPTCLAGDVIGDYNFKEKLNVDDILVFGDMAIYSTCKNNTFNGMPLPNIWRRKDGKMEKITNFGYDDFKMRLGK